ncbi:unnamed protein product, partial [Adineta ricciae]
MSTNLKNNGITRIHHSQSQPSTFKIPGQSRRSLSQDQNSRSRTKDKRSKVIIHTTIRSVTKSINSTNNKLLSAPSHIQDTNHDREKTPRQNSSPTRTHDKVERFEEYNQGTSSIANNQARPKSAAMTTTPFVNVTIVSTAATTMSTTPSPTISTTVSTTASTTISTTVSTTASTTISTTVSTTASTTISTTVSTTASTTIST